MPPPLSSTYRPRWDRALALVALWALLILGIPGCEGGAPQGETPEGRSADSSAGGVGADGTPAAETAWGDEANPWELDGLPAVDAVEPEALLVQLEARAEALADRPYHPPPETLPGELEALGYDAYRSLRYRPDAALWRGLSDFEIQFFHPGFLYTTPVRIHEVTEEGISAVPFDPRAFAEDSGEPVEPRDVEAEAAISDLDWAGFRVHFPLNDPQVRDEVAIFLGASYFRLLGQGHAHGLSGRGLAVDTSGEADEEFPEFREFWLVRPAREDDRLLLFALLDGPSVTGAYRFDLVPGDPTIMEVDARLFARRQVEVMGIAPLTSMFLFDEATGPAFDDFRPRVHDSDGLLMWTRAGEWIWRPLSNGPGLQVTSLQDTDPRGFGLVQRERRFDRYLDLEAHYHRRPSLWVEPLGGDWDAGGVELVEIPTESEFHDNIVAYWAMETPLPAGERASFRYRLRTFDDKLEEEELGRMARYRVAWDALPGQADPPSRSQRRIVVDFHGGALEEFGADGRGWESVEAELGVSQGEVSGLRLEPLPGGRGMRATFHLVPNGSAPADLRLFLHHDWERLTETWSYHWIPGREREALALTGNAAARSPGGGR